MRRPDVDGPRGRYAPSPTGLIHVGNARTALVAWLSARSRGGSFVWRLEDLDGPRTVPGMAAAALADLAWLGLDWDEGGGRGGPHAPYEQSGRSVLYERALDLLAAKGRLFPCKLSRADLAQLASAPHGHDGAAAYPSTLRPRDLPADWYPRHRAQARPEAALRFRVEKGLVAFEDRVYGEQQEDVAGAVGDFVLKRRDGLYAYQLAVVVDDLAMGINEVVRGRDLLDSTARQMQLIAALGGRPPAYAHLPLVLNAAGEKLSKRDAGLTLAALREAGARPEALVGAFAHSLGLLDRAEPVSATELVALFDWNRLSTEDWVLSQNFTSTLTAT